MGIAFESHSEKTYMALCGRANAKYVYKEQSIMEIIQGAMRASSLLSGDSNIVQKTRFSFVQLS